MPDNSSTDYTDSNISQRKVDHLELCATEDVESMRKSTLLDHVELMHDSLPELALEDVDLSTEFMGKTLRAPLLITGMTGGAQQAHSINRVLAEVAQEFGIAFGVGSQRAMLKSPELLNTYRVRDIAPDIAILSNIGAVQAAQMSTPEVFDLVTSIDADALCIHVNPGQELIQPEGDRDFRGCIDGIARLCSELKVPIIVKETGCGLSMRTLDKLKSAGVQWVDTSGAGGTTWIGVEALRTTTHQREIGELFWDWGVPTAASIMYAKKRHFNIIGSGGIRHGLDAAKAISLGAHIAGMALPWLRAAHEGGLPAARALAAHVIDTLRVTCMLTGSRNLEELRAAPKIIGAPLRQWTEIDAK